MNTKTLLFCSTLMMANSTFAANVAFEEPNAASWGGWNRGDVNTSYVHWDVINALSDNSPDGGNLGTTSALLNANNAGAFITGGGLGGNVYSFSDTPDFTVAVQPDYASPTEPVTVALQLKVLGTDLDLASIKLDGVAWDSTSTLFSGNAGGPFGGQDKEYLFVWNDVTASAAYALDFMATGSSMSLDEVSVDIGVSAVPLPASVWLLMSAMSGLSLMRRKQKIAG